MRGMTGHQRGYRGETDEWLTPPEILGRFPLFDFDPCSPVDRPWDTARKHLTVDDDGLLTEWPQGSSVWLNPPYGKQIALWMRSMADHGDGVALVFARTETSWFFRSCWGRASAMLFIEGRLHFHRPDGSRARCNAGAPSVLVGYGDRCAGLLRECGIKGAFVDGFGLRK